MTDDNKEKAGRKMHRAADDMEEAADAVDNVGQEKHISDLAEEARKTAEVLEDQAETEE